MHQSTCLFSRLRNAFHPSKFYRDKRYMKPAPSTPPTDVTFSNSDLAYIARELKRACRRFSMRQWLLHNTHLNGAPLHAVVRRPPRPERRSARVRNLTLSSATVPSSLQKWLKVIYLKGPVNAYTMFLKSVRRQVRQRHPDAHFVQRWRIIADMYRRLSTNEKAAYKDKATLLNTRYRYPLFR